MIDDLYEDEKPTRKFSKLPEHTQLYLSALLADFNYLKGVTFDFQYSEAKKRYENACKREGVRPYDELVEENSEEGEEGSFGKRGKANATETLTETNW